MRALFIILISLLVFSATGQTNNLSETETYANELKKNIFRLSLIVLMPYDDGWPLAFSYERKIVKPFTAVLKAGPIFQHDEFGENNNPHRFYLSGYGSAELRYYFNLNRRIRKEKHARNFTANYLSLERQALTRTLATMNVEANDKREGRSYTYLNIGHQRQFRKGYLNAFFGPTISIKESMLEVDEFHIGLGLGVVLFD